jgi:hypothetical protein
MPASTRARAPKKGGNAGGQPFLQEGRIRDGVARLHGEIVLASEGAHGAADVGEGHAPRANHHTLPAGVRFLQRRRADDREIVILQAVDARIGDHADNLEILMVRQHPDPTRRPMAVPPGKSRCPSVALTTATRRAREWSVHARSRPPVRPMWSVPKNPGETDIRRDWTASVSAAPSDRVTASLPLRSVPPAGLDNAAAASVTPGTDWSRCSNAG